MAESEACCRGEKYSGPETDQIIALHLINFIVYINLTNSIICSGSKIATRDATVRRIDDGEGKIARAREESKKRERWTGRGRKEG